MNSEINIEKTLVDVAKVPDRIDHSLNEMRKIRLESSKRLRFWVIALTFAVGLLFGSFATGLAMRSSELGCKIGAFNVQDNQDGFVWCLYQLSIPAEQT